MINRRTYHRRKRQTKPAHAIYFDHKDLPTLASYLNRFGMIESRYKTKLKEMQQRHLARAIKRARHLALLPFVGSPEIEKPQEDKTRETAKKTNQRPNDDRQ